MRIAKACLEQKADALLCLGNFAPHYPPVPTVILLHNAYFVYPVLICLPGGSPLGKG